MKKRAICALLAMLMAFSLLPVPAYAAGDVPINDTTFPDPVFQAYVRQFDTAAPTDQLSAQELAAVKDISVQGMNISRLKGIEYFTELTSLNCNSCGLQVLDVRKNTKLQELYCAYNEIRKLDVSQNTALRELSCSENKITVLNLSSNKALTYLACDRNPLNSLDVSQNTALTALMCYDCSLTSLDISHNKKLASLACYGNEIKKLDISRSTNLVKAYRKGQKEEHGQVVSYWIEVSGHYYGIDVSTDTKIVCVAPPKITSQPKSVSVRAGKKVTFRVKATGDALKYQWYLQKPGTKKWTKVKNAAKAVLTFKATKKMNGYKYRCRVYNKTASVYSKTVKLKIKK